MKRKLLKNKLRDQSCENCVYKVAGEPKCSRLSVIEGYRKLPEEKICVNWIEMNFTNFSNYLKHKNDPT